MSWPCRYGKDVQSIHCLDEPDNVFPESTSPIQFPIQSEGSVDRQRCNAKVYDPSRLLSKFHTAAT